MPGKGIGGFVAPSLHGQPQIELAGRPHVDLEIGSSYIHAAFNSYHLNGLEPVLEHLPDLTLRIEHLGRCPHDAGHPDEHFDRVIQLAKYLNIHINIDGFLQHDYPDHFALSTYPFERYQPFVRQVIEAFGPQRGMWGSEFPFLNNPYDIGIRFINEMCSYLSANDRELIVGKTAANLWGFAD